MAQRPDAGGKIERVIERGEDDRLQIWLGQVIVTRQGKSGGFHTLVSVSGRNLVEHRRYAVL